MSADIIKLTFPRRANRGDQQTPATVHHVPVKPELSRSGSPLAPAATDSCRNQRARLRRRDTWRHAERVTDYWMASIKWNDALASAQRHGSATPESMSRSAKVTHGITSSLMARRSRRPDAHPRAGCRRCSLEAREITLRTLGVLRREAGAPSTRDRFRCRMADGPSDAQVAKRDEEAAGLD